MSVIDFIASALLDGFDRVCVLLRFLRRYPALMVLDDSKWLEMLSKHNVSQRMPGSRFVGIDTTLFLANFVSLMIRRILLREV